MAKGQIQAGVDSRGERVDVGMVNDAPKSTDQTIHAGERRPTSTEESYVSVKEDWNYTRVDFSAATTIYDGPAILGAIYVDTALSAVAHPVHDDATPVFSLIASLAAGTELTAMKGTRFETSLKTPISGTGIGVVQWRKL